MSSKEKKGWLPLKGDEGRQKCKTRQNQKGNEAM